MEKDCAVAEIVEERNNGRLDVQTVEPKGEDTSLSLALGVKVVNVSLLFLGNGVETWVSVEEVGNKGKVELGVSGNKRCGGEELATFEFVGIVEDLLGSLKEILGLKRTTRADVRLELVEEDGVVFAIFDVGREVLDTLWSCQHVAIV